MRRVALAIALLVAFSAIAQAQNNTKVYDAMKKISMFVGSWNTTDAYDDKDNTKGGSSFKITTLYKGMHFKVEKVRVHKKKKYSSTELWSYNTKSKEYVLTVADDQGNVRQYKGKFTDDKTLKLKLSGGKIDLVYRIYDKDHFAVDVGDGKNRLSRSECCRKGRSARKITCACEKCPKKKEMTLGGKKPK